MILITGGLGFFGTSLARYLLEQGEEVLLTRWRTSRIPTFLTKHLDKKLKVVDCNILDFTNLFAVLKKHPVKSIIHTAMVTLAKASLYQGVKTSLEGTANVLEAARLMDIEKVTYTSSLTVYYGIKSEMPYKETMAIAIDVKHPIASEKIAAEAICNLYAEQVGLELIIVRPSMIYGPGSYSGYGPLPLMVEGVVREKRVVIPQFHPEYSMDFLYIDDCSRAIGMIHLTKEPKDKVYNIATGKSHTLKEVTEVINKLIPDSHIELKGESPPRDPFILDVSRLRDEFGYQPKYDLEHGIQEYIDWIVRGKT